MAAIDARELALPLGECVGKQRLVHFEACSFLNKLLYTTLDTKSVLQPEEKSIN